MGLGHGRLRLALSLALLLALAGGCTSDRAARGDERPPDGGEVAEGEPLVILYTSDIHGLYDARPAGRNCPLAGGFAALDARRREIEKEGKPVLLVDAGDLMTGHPICDAPYKGVRGGALMAFMNAARYDAWCLGNHEFDPPLPDATAFLRLARFPTLCANLDWPDAPEGLVRPSVIVEKGKLKIGIVGLMTERLPRLLNREKKDKVGVTPILEAARREVEALDPKTDLIILLTHQGFEEDKALARKLEGAGVDVIVGGHSHTPVYRSPVVAGTIVCQNAPKLRKVGRLDVVVANDRVVSHKAALLDLPAADPAPGSEMEKIAREVDELLSDSLKQVVGVAKTNLGRNYYNESPLGNWLADTLRAEAEADVGLVNSGGIRSDIRAGPITVGAVHEALLDNRLCVFEATGEQIAKLARHNAEAAATEDHGILQVSGLSYRYKRDGKTVAMLDVQVGGKPVDPAARYRVVATDFVAVDQPDKYLGFKPSGVEDMGRVMTEVVIAAIRAAGEIEGAPPLGRIVVEH